MSVPRLRICAGFLIGGVFIFLALRTVELSAVGSALARADLRWILMALVSMLTGFTLRCVRWWLMVQAVASPNKVGFRVCLAPFFVSYSVNNVLPLRIGDAIRVVGFNRVVHCSLSSLFATLVVERVFDLLILLSMAYVAGLAAPRFDLFKVYFLPLQILVPVAIAGATAALFVPAPAMALIDLIVKRAPSRGTGIGFHIAESMRSIFQAMDRVRVGSSVPALLCLSVVAWIAEGMVFVFVAYGLGSGAAPSTALFVYVMSNLSQTIPGTPGNFGTFEFIALEGLVGLAGLAPALAASVALVAHLVIWIPVTLIGAAYLLVNPALQQTGPTTAKPQPDLVKR